MTITVFNPAFFKKEKGVKKGSNQQPAAGAGQVLSHMALFAGITTVAALLFRRGC